MNTTTSSDRAPLPRNSSSWMQWAGIGTPGSAPAWMQVAWTLMFSAGIAAGFTLLIFVFEEHAVAQWLDPHLWAVRYGQNLVVSLTIGFIIQAMYVAARKVLGVSRILALGPVERVVFYGGIPVVGTAIGWPIGVTLLFGDLRILRQMTSGDALAILMMSVLLSTLFFIYFSLRVSRARAEMRASEAQLRLLQGQMEPHFLFNTLANVISLIDIDAPRAKHVLEAFTDYLRASLGALRRTDSTLGTELELATRFLQLMQTRMGDRLRFEIDADPALRQAVLPPLLLQPLIENAVKHGLEPRIDGGTVRVQAARVVVDGVESLQLCVDDDGAGLAASAARPRRTVAGGPDGHGIAVANLRERLQAQFGAQGRLTLSEREPASGTRSCLVVPWKLAEAGPAKA